MKEDLLIIVAILFAIVLLLAVAIVIREKLSSTNDEGGWKFESLKTVLKDYGTILLVIAGIAVFYFGVYSETSWESPSFPGFVNRCREHWFWVLVFAGILFALIVRSGLAEKTRAALYWVIAATLLFLFIVAPFWLWATEPSKPTPQLNTRTEVPLASRPVSEWNKIILEPRGKSRDIYIPVGKRIIKHGFKFKVHVRYYERPECSQVFGLEKDCPDGPITSICFENLADEENTISYAFVPM